MKLKAARATFKHSGPVQCRDWLESPPTSAGGFFFEPLLTPRRQIVTGGLRDPDPNQRHQASFQAWWRCPRTGPRAGFRPTSARRGAMKIPSGRRKQQHGEIGFAQAQWQLAQVITVEREAIERVKLNLDIMLTGLQSAETGHPSTPSNTGSAPP
jgi:hypothetical protein